MAFREKLAWAGLGTTLLVWGWYFAALVRGLADGGEDFGAVNGRFVLAVILIVAIQIVVAIVLAIAAPKEADAPADDRERQFELTAQRAAYQILSILTVIIMLATPLTAQLAPALLRGDPASATAIVFGNAILFALVAAEVTRSAWLIARFRVGG